MYRWFGLSLLLVAGAAQAAPSDSSGRPVASHFDLTRSLTERIAFNTPSRTSNLAERWSLHDIEVPPGPPRDPPMVRVRGKHVKVRIPL